VNGTRRDLHDPRPYPKEATGESKWKYTFIRYEDDFIGCAELAASTPAEGQPKDDPF
jgi:hypothetical protein